MPRKADNTGVETEKGFGTGLRTKLEDRRPAKAEPSSEPTGTEAEAEPVADDDSELSETEQLWSELEESLAREEALKRQLEDQSKAYQETRELGRRLAERADALQRREQEVEAQFKALEQEAARSDAAEPEHGRAYLRRQVEDNGEALWRVFQEALTASKPNGEPDFRLRLMAASTLLAEAYGDTALLSPGEQVAAARDELAGMRAKRASKPR
jgi:DNA repair exonuclease SbcCD ATPase subunit